MRRLGRPRRGPGLLATAARTAVIAGTATSVSGRVAAGQQAAAQREQQGREAQAQLAALHQQQQVDAQVAAALAQAPTAQAPTAQPAGGAGDVLDQLARLGELRASGVLTEEEFGVQKARILGS